MTCIAAIADKGKVWMGGDNGAFDSPLIYQNALGKVFKSGPFVMGCTGSHRLGNLLRFSFRPPELIDDLDSYMVEKFAAELRSILGQSGQLKNDAGLDKCDGNILVGIYGRLFSIDTDLSILPIAGDYHAIGYGAQVAFGALYATKGLKPEERLRLALEAGEKWTDGVRGPFAIESI